jgi:hypothetical protein
MADPASPTAKWALGISIVVAAFSIFQWFATQKEARISSAIEISRNYFKDRDLAGASALAKAYTGVELSDDEALLVARDADFLNYVALLLNAGRLEQQFIEEDIQCAMLVMFQAQANLKESSPALKEFFSSPQIAKFVPRAKCEGKENIDRVVGNKKKSAGPK